VKTKIEDIQDKVQSFLDLARGKRVEEIDDNVAITKPLAQDLKKRVDSAVSALTSLQKEVDDILDSGSIKKQDLLKIRDFSGHLALLCNMILTGKPYTKEQKENSIEDNLT
jgi:hypothetical protein